MWMKNRSMWIGKGELTSNGLSIALGRRFRRLKILEISCGVLKTWDFHLAIALALLDGSIRF